MQSVVRQFQVEWRPTSTGINNKYCYFNLLIYLDVYFVIFYCFIILFIYLFVYSHPGGTIASTAWERGQVRPASHQVWGENHRVTQRHRRTQQENRQIPWHGVQVSLTNVNILLCTQVPWWGPILKICHNASWETNSSKNIKWFHQPTSQGIHSKTLIYHNVKMAHLTLCDNQVGTIMLFTCQQGRFYIMCIFHKRLCVHPWYIKHFWNRCQHWFFFLSFSSEHRPTSFYTQIFSIISLGNNNNDLTITRKLLCKMSGTKSHPIIPFK